MSYDNIDPRTKTSTDTPLSDAGESSSEQAGAIIASLQQQQLQRSVNHSTAQNIMMSKAEHEAIFGRPNSNPSNYHQEQLNNSGHRSIIAHEVDNVEYYDQVASNNNVQAPAPANNTTKNNQELPPNVAAMNGRSPRFIPTQVSNIPSNMIGSTQNTHQGQGNYQNIAPTALMIMRRRRMRRRRSNSTDLNNSLSSSGGKGGRSKILDELNTSNKSGGSSSQENKRSPKTTLLPKGSSPKVSAVQHNQNLNNDMNTENLYNAAIQQQQQVYNLMALSAAAQAAQQQQQNATAMRYNSSLHSTIGGYPMGTPTQLTHPSVTLELIARDRARWEADYYNSSGGMDYGYDYGGGDNGGGYYGATPSFRTMSSGMGQQSQNVAQRGRGDSMSGQPQQQQNFYLPKSLHQQNPHRQQQQAQAQGPDLDNRGTSSSVVHQQPQQQQEIQASPHRSNKNRVFQERDYKNDRVWQEDDHTSTGITASPASLHDRRLTEKTSNRVNDKQHYQAQQSESGVESSPKLPPVPRLRGSGGGQQATFPQAIPSHSHQVPLPQSHQVPLSQSLQEGRQGGQFGMDQNPYQHHSAAGIVPTPGQYYNQNVPSTPVRERDPLERQISDISSICGSVGGGAHVPVPVVYPNGTYGLIYPPTPGGIHHPLPPQQVVPPGLYQHDPRQQGGDMGWMNSQVVHQTMPPQHPFDHGVKAVSPVDEESHSNSGSSMKKPSSSRRNLGSMPPSSSASPQVQAQRRVSFGHLEIRTYETILGDNPSCSGGPSLGLGWRYDPNHDTISVDEYEAHLAHMYGLPAGTSYIGRPEDLVLHRIEREAILLNTGYTRQDLADSIRSLNKVKNKRRQTVHNLPVAYFEEKAEVVKRTLRRWVRKRERTRHMYEDWKKKCVEGTS